MPPTASTFDFPPFRLDLRAGQLCRDTTPVPLRPKTFAVLQYLLEHPGELVTKGALLDAVWGEIAVSEDVVRISVRELRAALGDERGTPRFIQTVHRRGYRFLATVVTDGQARSATTADVADADRLATAPPMVGRGHEKAQIVESLEAAAGGRRQVVFVSGEAGIGKTTLVDAVLRELRGAPGRPARVARGQCVEHYGSGQPYLPVLEAIDGLRRGPLGPSAEASLRHLAPAWLLRAVGIQSSGQEDLLGSSARAPEHTLHALAASLDGLAADTPLVLVLEDVHWIDHSTLDLLSLLAQRRHPARLLVLCTLRPADAIARGHPVVPVKRELLRKGLCREIPLSGLSAADVASYLAARFSGAETASDLLPLLVDRSEGNPFFIVALLDHLVDRGLLVEQGGRWELRDGCEALRTVIPDGLRALVEPRLDRLTGDEIDLLEAGSVAGSEFAVDVVARIAPPESRLADVAYVERLCNALARRQEILRERDEAGSRDGAAAAHYEFRHALYQQVLYQRLPSSQRRRLHQAIGETLEATHGGRTVEIAAALATHFERSRDVDRAVRYRGEAAAHARSRFAYLETRLHLEAALALLREQDEAPERLRQELSLLQELGVTLFAIEGYGHEDGARVFARMRELSERVDGGSAHFQAMEGQLIVHTMRAEFAVARALGEELIVLAERLGNPTATANTHLTHSATLYNVGEAEAAYRHAERGRALFDPDAPAAASDIGVLANILLASTSGYLGRLARARAFNREALTRADVLGTPFHRALATNLAAGVCMLLDDVSDTRLLADEALRLADEYDFSALRITATMFRGWCDVEDGRIDDGLAALRGAFQQYGATGQHFGTTSFSMLLARAHLASGDVAGASEVVEASLRFAATTGECVYVPEFHRLRGECLLASAGPGEPTQDATHAFERALAIAAERKGLLFELRAATSLCRVAGASARARLAAVVDRFDAADDGANLRTARALLGGG